MLFRVPFQVLATINDKKIVQTIMDAAKNAKTFSIYGVEYNYTGNISGLYFPSLTLN